MERLINSFKDISSYRNLLERLDVAVYIQNSHGEIVDANTAFLKIFGATSIETLCLAPQELLGRLQPLAKRLDLQNRDRILRKVALPDPSTSEMITYLEVSFAEEEVAKGDVYYSGILVPAADEKVYAEVEKQNLRDPLTGTFNRHYLKVYEKANGAQSWGCVLFCMDRLRRFSELFGESAALEAICKMGRYILRFVRVQDPVVRLDEEQFLLLITGDEPALHRVVRRLKNTAMNQAPLAFSMGVAFHREGEPLEETIFRAGRDLAPIKVLERLPRRHAG